MSRLRFRDHYDLRRVDRLVLSLMRRDLERFRDRFDPFEYVSDRGLKVHTTRGDQMNGVLQMAARADVGKEIPQTPFAQRVDVELQRLAEPRNADDLASRTHRLDRLHHRLVPGEALL